MAKNGRDMVTWTHEIFSLLALTKIKSIEWYISVVSKITSCMQIPFKYNLNPSLYNLIFYLWHKTPTKFLPSFPEAGTDWTHILLITGQFSYHYLLHFKKLDIHYIIKGAGNN